MNNFYKERADENIPQIFTRRVSPQKSVKFISDESKAFGVGVVQLDEIQEIFSKGDSITVDFGEHLVGNISFNLSKVDNYIDAPVKIRFRFGEIPMELYRNFDSYEGMISGSWLQEEIITVDYPGNISLPRRYCFRYMEVTVLETPQKVRISDFLVNHLTSADRGKMEDLKIEDKELMEIDKISAKTLEGCMQSVYEDGPKRDRRLWSGDFRLQALSDYYVFKNYMLIRRCLYLFAACHNEGKYLPSCLYHYPELFSKKTSGFMDYAFLYTVAICEYYQNTKDIKTAKELFDIVKSQMELAIQGLDKNGIITIPTDSNGFIDWAPGVSKLIATHGVFLFALEKNIELAKAVGEIELADSWGEILRNSREGAYKVFFDAENERFVKEGDNYQYSVHSQVWMILGGVTDKETGRCVLEKALSNLESIKPVSPYMHHYVVEAMFKIGMDNKAKDYIKGYWGKMVELGADTFWEVFVPDDLSVSPYGDAIINSFCHAWSCTPSYFIRKYLK